MTKAFWIKVAVAAFFGAAGGAAVDLRKYQQREDKAQPFNWRAAGERWLVGALGAALAAAGITVGGELPAPASD